MFPLIICKGMNVSLEERLTCLLSLYCFYMVVLSEIIYCTYVYFFLSFLMFGSHLILFRLSYYMYIYM